MEKVLIITYNLSNALREKKRPAEEARALNDLNKSLAEGWAVKAMSPFSGTEHSFLTAMLVILEKE